MAQRLSQTPLCLFSGSPAIRYQPESIAIYRVGPPAPDRETRSFFLKFFFVQKDATRTFIVFIAHLGNG
jgi:hypothetical protein